ncbi:HTH domain-containing protein [bacterium SCSIO 12741]|nr:HTH domain-containing protein [bacterium SCSIO 12741]
MNFRTYQYRLEYLKERLVKGQLSSPHDLADQFDCSEKTIRNMINRLREDGMDIEYDRSRRKYFVNN